MPSRPQSSLSESAHADFHQGFFCLVITQPETLAGSALDVMHCPEGLLAS